MGNLNKRKSAFKQQCFKLDEEWKAFMEAKVDSMVEFMAKIKAMLHKRHRHFEIDTYTYSCNNGKEWNFFQGDGNYFGAICSHLGPHPSIL